MHPIPYIDVTHQLDVFPLFDFKHKGSQMKLSNSSTLALVVAITRAQTWAITAADYNIHPSGCTASTLAAKAMPSKSKQAMAGMDAQMKSMQEIHNIWSFQ